MTALDILGTVALLIVGGVLPAAFVWSMHRSMPKDR